VTFTATVSANTPGAGTPTGTVTFTITDSASNTIASGAGTSIGNGQFTFTTSALVVSDSMGGGTPYSVVASYGGDTNFTASNNSASPFSQTVNAANTTTTVTSSTNPTTGAVTFTATVAAVAPGSGTPADGETVNFSVSDGTTTVDSGSGTLTGGQATFTSSALTPGTAYQVTATYVGDTNFTTSDNTAGANLVAGATLSYTAPTVTITLAGLMASPVPGGRITVTFTDQTTSGSVTSPATPLTAGAATFDTSAAGLNLTTGDTYLVTILYTGNTSYIMQTNLLSNPGTFTV
jgi:hypothetical protein